jgi:hypothetical protein
VPELPGINHLDAVRALEKAGFGVVRQGKHIVMTDGVRILTNPTPQSRECPHYGGHRARRRSNN